MATSSSSAADFNFFTVKQLQIECSHLPITTHFHSENPVLERVASTLASNDCEKALETLNPFIEKQSQLAQQQRGREEVRPREEEEEEETTPSPKNLNELLHEALILRGDIFAKMSSFREAKDDVQKAITIAPNCIVGYAKLSDVEWERKQYGGAEVALTLGLRLDADNEELKAKLRAIRNEDEVFPDVNHQDGSDEPVRMKHAEAGEALSSTTVSPLIEFVMVGDIERLKRVWRSDMVGYKNGEVKNPLMHFPVVGLQRINPANAQGNVSAAENHKTVIDFLFDQGVRLDARDKAGYTAVMHAAGHTPQPALLEHLLRKGADPDVRSVYGSVALLDATHLQDALAVDILLAHGANPNIVDNDGLTPFKHAEKFKEIIAVYHRRLYPEMPVKVCAKCPNETSNKRCKKF